MKTLLLLRHAKSSWEDAALDDHDRPLNARGHAAAPAMGRQISLSGHLPDLILCSTSRRTVETLDHVLPFLRRGTPVRYERDLYLADWAALLARLQWADDSAATLLLVGHNPGLEQLAVALSVAPKGDTGEAAALKRLAEKFPTGSLAVIGFDVASWREVAPGQGRLIAFTRPRDL